MGISLGLFKLMFQLDNNPLFIIILGNFLSQYLSYWENYFFFDIKIYYLRRMVGNAKWLFYVTASFCGFGVEFQVKGYDVVHFITNCSANDPVFKNR